LKNVRVWTIFVATVILVAFVMSFIGIPTTIVGPAAAMVVVAFIVIRANNRKVINVAPAERDRLLAEGPPDGYGLVYVHRPSGIGGFAVGFNVNLDNVDVAMLKLSRFARLVVAPGNHRLTVGLKKQPGAIIANQISAETSLAVAAGETAVFGLKYGEGKMVKPLLLYREADTGAALAKLATAEMVAAVQPAALERTAGVSQP
jgi:hypothetical protein